MDDWLHNLSLKWMALVIFAIVYPAAGAIFAIIMLLAKGERAHIFKRVSPGLLSPLGTVFGLLVVFSIFQVWGDFDRARDGRRSRSQCSPDGGTAGRQLSGRTGDTDSQPCPPPHRRSGRGRVARDGETSGLFEGRCAGIVGLIAVGSFSDAPEPRANRGAASDRYGAGKCHGCPPGTH